MTLKPITYTPDQEQKVAKMLSLQHAMQSGIAMLMNYDRSSTSPKHLRVGVNSAMVEASALAHLLMEKGVFTMDEYLDSMIGLYEQEVQSYCASIEAAIGAKPGAIKLG